MSEGQWFSALPTHSNGQPFKLLEARLHVLKSETQMSELLQAASCLQHTAEVEPHSPGLFLLISLDRQAPKGG